MRHNSLEGNIARQTEHYFYSSTSNYACEGGGFKLISLKDGIEFKEAKVLLRTAPSGRLAPL